MDAYLFSLLTIFTTVYFLYVASTPQAAAAKKELAGIKGDEWVSLVARFMVHALR
jgi:hypothetical protein